MKIKENKYKSPYDQINDIWSDDLDNDVDNNESEEECKTVPIVNENDKAETESNHEKGDLTQTDSSSDTEKDIEKQTGKKRKKAISFKEIYLYRKQKKAFEENRDEEIKDIYNQEESGNRHDFIITGIIVSFIVVAIVVITAIASTNSNRILRKSIDAGNYAVAYQEIQKRYEKGKNVDNLIYTFVEESLKNEEYKKAVASLDMLSENANTNVEFFENIVETMYSKQKYQRVNEVLMYMHTRGGDLDQKAIEIEEMIQLKK